MIRFACAVCLCALVLSLSSLGPAYAADAESAPAIGPPNIISTNPILDMFTWYNIEYERRILPNSTIGLGASYVTLNDENDSYMSASAFYRWYPQQTAPEGFFFGGRLALTTIEDKPSEDSLDDLVSEEATVFGIGIDIGYTWLIGTQKRFALSLGIGAIRFFGGDLEDAATTLPTIRLVNCGIAF